jgi:hypothetical protein
MRKTQFLSVFCVYRQRTLYRLCECREDNRALPNSWNNTVELLTDQCIVFVVIFLNLAIIIVSSDILNYLDEQQPGNLLALSGCEMQKIN